jgi:Domain of unknown function (DUF4381)
MLMLQTAMPTQGPQLRDIHLPPPPSWWPPAPGWWLLAALVLGLSIFCFVYLYKKIGRQRRRSALLAEFDRIVAAAQAKNDAPQIAAALSAFLRRQSLRAAPNAAALSGTAWLQHLDARSGTDEFSAGPGRALVEAPYRATADFDATALIELVRRTVGAIFDREAGHV